MACRAREETCGGGSCAGFGWWWRGEGLIHFAGLNRPVDPVAWVGTCRERALFSCSFMCPLGDRGGEGDNGDDGGCGAGVVVFV